MCGRGHRCTAGVADVRDPASVAAAIKRARKKEGRIDVLVNNAGVCRLWALSLI
ncbi:SDR family NAD(P)-dependent oxidoreductase [Shigella sonnei]